MENRQQFRCLRVAIALGLILSAPTSVFAGQERQVFQVPSKDGTLIAVECAGSGPTLLIVHGGIGDRTRWTPMFPLLASRFTVCAMDRRGHGTSGDSPNYSLQKEAEDIAAVVNGRPGTVFLLGHSYGGVAALEASFLTNRISRLLLYEPPLQDRVDLTVVDRIEKMIQDGNREQAVVTFLREVVMVSPSELDAMRSRPMWRRLVDSIDSHPRQMRALAAYRFDLKRLRTLSVPTLLIKGSETDIPDVKRAMDSLMTSLPFRTQVVLKGQQHNAMDTGRELLANAITNFLFGTADRPPRN
ncbi:MAG TPA: alpha/beta hydrolase [Pyrinomonadaceae bacterium]|nr:alpha/beta hydrolase [Pyrinomonadaceae bacterium]